jgi:DNA-binding XRE family transcriptional regulator
MTKPQIIEQDGKPAFVVLPISEWERIQERLEDISDQAAIDRFRTEGHETFPAAVVDALIAGENPIRTYRKHRSLTQHDLAKAAEITVPYLSQIESGKREPSLDVAKRLAASLSISVDDLV